MDKNKSANNSQTPFVEGMGKAADDVITSQYPYWSAILTFNGILIALFATKANNLSNKYVAFILVIIALMSSILIIMNFRTRRNWLEDIAKIYRLSNESEELRKKIINRKKEQAPKVYSRIKKRENIFSILLIPEAILIIWLMILWFC
jgi:hypothetical protein